MMITRETKLIAMSGAFMFFVGWVAHMNFASSSVAGWLVATGGAVVLALALS